MPSKKLIDAKITINLRPLAKYQKIIDKDLKASGNGPVAKALNQIATRYRAFLQERFAKFSRGGGDWKPLAPMTIWYRPRQSTAILRDTGLLFAGLTPVFSGAPGQFQERIKGGIRIGYGGTGGHSGNVTVAELAKIHHFGEGHVPARPIIVKPTSDLVHSMAGDIERAIAKIK